MIRHDVVIRRVYRLRVRCCRCGRQATWTKLTPWRRLLGYHEGWCLFGTELCPACYREARATECAAAAKPEIKRAETEPLTDPPGQYPRVYVGKAMPEWYGPRCRVVCPFGKHEVFVQFWDDGTKTICPIRCTRRVTT